MATANPEAQRRALDFRSWDEVLADLDALQANGYDRAGNWDLAQCCGHLADWMAYPLDGYPVPPWPVRAIFAVLRRTIVPGSMRKMLATRVMPAGSPTLKETVPMPGGDESAAVDRLRATIARFRAHEGPFRESPLFGAIDRERGEPIQLIHCAHHLSFLRPRAPRAGGA